MMLDTIAIARELRAAEVAPGQAGAIASAIGRAIIDGAATKADLELVKIELRGEIRSTAEALKSSMLTWFVGTQLAVGAIIIAALKL